MGMKLFIKRDQEDVKGFFGGSKGIRFSLNCRIELTPEETALVEKYKQWDLTVHSYPTTSNTNARWSLADMTKGCTVTCDGVGALFNSEEEVKKACANTKVLLNVMNSFGGQEELEF
jgi:hypothetical protein